jgi:hypothetical protein
MSRNHRYVRSALTSAVGVIAFAVAAANAFAGPPTNPSTARTATLTLADLDLSQTADMQIAPKLCEQVRSSLSPSPHQAFDDCAARAAAGAEPKFERLASAQAPATKCAAAQR